MTRQRDTPSVLVLLLALAGLGLIAACGWGAGSRAASAAAWPTTATPRPFDVAAPTGQDPASEPAPAAARGRGDPGVGTELRAVGVLHAWDRRRAAAYASGSVPRLRDLYLPGADAGRADVRLLRDYRARGFRVTGMRMQLLAVEVLAAPADELRLRVTDRLARATAVRGGRRVLLPRDAASTRLVVLVRGVDRKWRVARVSVAAPR